MRSMSDSSESRPDAPLHSPFTSAVAGGRLEEVKLLVADPATDVNWQGFLGNTGLHWAVANSKTNMAIYLLDEVKRIDVNIQDSQGKTALQLAIGKGWEHFTDHPQANTNEPPQAPVIDTLMERTDLRKVDHDGNTALHIAMMRRDVAVVESFLTKDIELFDIANHQGKTPLDLLTMRYEEVKEFLNTYVRVFTLESAKWEEKRTGVLAAITKRCQDLPVNNNLSVWLSELKNQDEDTASEPDNEQPKLSEPDLFKQPKKYVKETLDYLNANHSDLISIIDSINQLSVGLEELTQSTQDSLSRDKITAEEAKILAEESFKFVQLVANLAVEKKDIQRFKQMTAAYRTLMPRALGFIIGAAIGIGIAVALMFPPTSIPAVAVCLVSGGAGGFLGLFAGKQYSKCKNPMENALLKLDNSASEITRMLK